jgi:soluble lytic murein transglycosylase
MSSLALLPLVVAALPLAAAPVAELNRGQKAFWAGQYEKAARTLTGLPARLPRTRDYVLYLGGESEFYAGRPARARALFAQLAAERESRFAPLAPWRVADCLWAEGRKAEAVVAYRRLLAAPPAGVDAVVARFRIAQLAGPAEAGKLLRDIHREHPAHPLAAEAAQGAEPDASPQPTRGADPRARLRRAALLVEGRHVEEAIAELEALPAALPPDLAAERDFALGMAKFRTRHDYPAAAKLLLGVVPRLQAEKAAFAAFHGARALARANRTDESIAANRRVIEQFPGSRWAAEAQFMVGWLEFNRGRYLESVPGLRATIERSRRNPYASGAAWYLALAYHFLGRHDEALATLEEYGRLAGNDADDGRRLAYWRARFLADADKGKGGTREARRLWRDLVAREPLSYYGLLARARLRQAGEAVAVRLPRSPLTLRPPARKALRDPAVLRADELARAGLTVDAGTELARSEDGIWDRLGREQALPLLLERYRRFQAFRRAYQLAETRGAAALQAAPVGATRTLWEAAYPRAYQSLVEKHSQTAHAPSLLVYAIMRKESGFGPHLTSFADARGLLQLLPAQGAALAATLETPFHDDDLFRPEVNIRLGALRIGDLIKTLRGQAFLAAGAYNGGVAPMLRWLDQQGRRPLDEFMEVIGFKDSREYSKRVAAIYARYVYLYTGKAYDLPLVVKAAVRTQAPREPEPPAPAAEETTP